MKTEKLREKIRHAINCVSAENGSNTPDFILAEYLIDCLSAFDKASMAREKWYGKSLSIGGITEPEEEKKIENMHGHFPTCPKCGSCAWLSGKCSHCGEPIPSPTPVAASAGGQEVKPVGDGLHYSCGGCIYWIKRDSICLSCCDLTPSVGNTIRKNWTPKEVWK